MDISVSKAYLKMGLLKINGYQYTNIESYLYDLSKTTKLNSILDIGACKGEFSLLCKKLWPEAYLFMIEANSSCVPYLQKSGIEFKTCLLGNENKDNIVFYKDKDSDISSGESIYKEKTHHFSNSVEILMEMKKLDDIVSKQFDFVKIDTQGSELDIIKGGINLIRKSKYVLLEVATKEYNSGAPLYDEVVAYMKSIGFASHHTIAHHIWASDEDTLFNKGDVFQKDVIFTK